MLIVFGLLVVLSIAIFIIVSYKQPRVEVPPPFDPTVFPETETLENLSKLEIEAIGRKYGIELDRRKSVKNLIRELQKWHRAKYN